MPFLYLKGVVYLSDLISHTASTITSVIVIGSALLWVYKKLVIEPTHKNDEKIYKKSSQELKDTIEPLSKSIDTLSTILDDSVQDRKQLNKRVDDHETRITVLEVKKF